MAISIIGWLILYVSELFWKVPIVVAFWSMQCPNPVYKLYIHKNPVKAGIVESPYRYAYSSCKQMQDKKRFRTKKIIFEKAKLNFEWNNNSREAYDFIDVNERTKKVARKDIETIIKEFCLKHNTSIQEVRKTNILIIKLKHYLNTEYKISNKNICAILGIGKNRISWIEKRMRMN